MPKHRQAGFAVVREVKCNPVAGIVYWTFNGLIGVYQSVQRAEEVSAATIQRFLDLGMDPNHPEYRCKVTPTNWYDE